MINYDDVREENINEHNQKQPQVPDHPYRILINGGSGSGKTYALPDLIRKQDDDIYSVIHKIDLYIKDPK